MRLNKNISAVVTLLLSNQALAQYDDNYTNIDADVNAVDYDANNEEIALGDQYEDVVPSDYDNSNNDEVVLESDESLLVEDQDQVQEEGLESNISPDLYADSDVDSGLNIDLNNIDDVISENVIPETNTIIINLGDETTILCGDHQGSETLAWDYSQDLSHFQDHDSNVVVMYNEPQVSKKDTRHLDGQLSMAAGNDSNIVINAENLDASGVYVCYDGDKKYSINHVKIINLPSVSIPDDMTIKSGASDNTISCQANNAYPKPVLSLYLGEELLAASSVDSDTQPNYEGFYDEILNYETLALREDQKMVNIKCVASHIDWPTDVIENRLIEAEYAPAIVTMEGCSSDNNSNTCQLAKNASPTLSCKSESNPDAKITWPNLAENFPAENSFTENNDGTVTLNNINAETFANKTITCRATNTHGSDEMTKNIIIIEPSASSETGGLSTTTIIIVISVLVVILIVILIAIFLVKKQSDSPVEEDEEADLAKPLKDTTNENGENSGEQAEAQVQQVDYRQDPETEAMTKEDKEVTKEAHV